MPLCRSWFLIVSLLASASTSALAAETSTYFRANHGVSSASGKALPEQLDLPTALVWRQSIAPGHSTPCVHGNAIYLTTFSADKKLQTVALDRTNGKLRWSHTVPNERIESYHPTGSPASSSPACDGQRIYAFFGSYGLICYDLQGNVLWKRPMGPFQDEFGSSSSPVLVEGKLLLNEDHDLNSFLLCLDATSGKTLWQTPRDGFTRSYSTPIVWSSGGKKQIIVAGALQLTGYDLESGKQLWSLNGLARIVNTTPAAADGLLYVATWSPGGDTDARIGMEPWDLAVKTWDKNKDGKLTREEVDNKDVLDRFYRIDLNQDQGLDQTEWVKYARVFEQARNSIMAIRPSDNSAAPPEVVWQYDKGIPYVPSPLVYQGVAYLIKDGGILTSFDARSGKVLKMARARGTGNYYASPVAGDGKIYLASERGVLTVLKAGGEWDVIGSRDLAERLVATPVIDDGRLYVRTEEALYCFARP